MVANRLQAHIKNNHLSNPSQSAYRKHHSTESALLKVDNDIIIIMDKGEVTALTLLDLSAAFDSIDHTTLTDRLSDWYRISGQAQIWFSSYLQNMHQSGKIKDALSDKESHMGQEISLYLVQPYGTPCLCQYVMQKQS